MDNYMRPYLDGKLDSVKDENFQRGKDNILEIECRNAAVDLYTAAEAVSENSSGKASLKEALQWVQKSYLLWPENFMMLHRMGIIHSKLRQTGKAIEYLKKAIVLAEQAGETSSVEKFKTELSNMGGDAKTGS